MDDVSRLLVAAAILAAAGASWAREDPVSSAPAAAVVTGSASFNGDLRKAPVVWVYVRDGERIESEVPPRHLAITRISSNVPQISIKLPMVPFAIKTPQDLTRTFDKPLQMDTDQKSYCSCNVRPDCTPGYDFSCEIEGTIVPPGQ